MAVNPDPKPGRWILPLVILGMIAFTYFFVRELPEATPETTLAVQATTTTVPETTDPTEPGGGELDPAVAAYLTEMTDINAELQVLRTEMVAVNDGFDADPREIEFSETETRIEVVVNDTQTLEGRVNDLTVPAGLEINHEALTTAIRFAALAAGDALDGLRSADTGELRRAAVQAYSQAVDDFDTEVTNARNAAENLQV